MPIPDELLARLRDAIGADAVNQQYAVVTPADAGAATVAVRVCAETATPLAICSNAEGSSATAPPGGVLLNLERLTAVEVRAPALTVRAGVGARVSAVQAQLAAQGLAITGLGPGVHPASIGALVARGAVSRRSLTGIEAVLANGDTISFGGVLKDVVGYDVPALLLGSLGRLAVLLAVTFRLEPAAAYTLTPASAPGPVPVDPALLRAFDPEALLRAPA